MTNLVKFLEHLVRDFISSRRDAFLALISLPIMVKRFPAVTGWVMTVSRRCRVLMIL